MAVGAFRRGGKRIGEAPWSSPPTVADRCLLPSYAQKVVCLPPIWAGVRPDAWYSWSVAAFCRRTELFTLVCAAAATLALAPAARAAEPGVRERAEVPPTPPPTRRDGLVVGSGFGALVSSTAGNPTNAMKRDDPAYHVSSGVLLGSQGEFYLMGALSDLVNFGLWFGGGSGENERWRSAGGGGGIRLEFFPWVRVLPRLGDLGLFAQFGVGSVKLEDKRGLSGGAQGVESALGAGAFYEWRVARLLGGHVAAGPLAGYHLIASGSADRHAGIVSARLVFYGGP
jgi:hypothetical protein